jgi:hypothetical protein
MDDSQALEKLVPEVRTLARPTSGPLLAARHRVQKNPEIRQLFIQAKEEGWSNEAFADRLMQYLVQEVEGSPDEVYQVALYLADEYRQLGDAVLVIAKDTGKAIGKITEKDLWKPGPVQREDGSIVERPLQLHPEIASFFVSWYFEKGYDEANLAHAISRLNQTDIQKEEGDRRVRVVTKQGRFDIIDEVRAELPVLLECVKGSAKAFLDHFQGVPTDDLFPTLRLTARSLFKMKIPDTHAMNLKFDVAKTYTASIGTSWVRDIARAVAEEVKSQKEPIPFSSLVGSPELPDLWVGQVFQDNPDIVELKVQDCPTIGLLPGRTGYLEVVPGSYRVEGREVSDRWEVGATCEVRVWLDVDRIVLVDVGELPARESVTELVH